FRCGSPLLAERLQSSRFGAARCCATAHRSPEAPRDPSLARQVIRYDTLQRGPRWEGAGSRVDHLGVTGGSRSLRGSDEGYFAITNRLRLSTRRMLTGTFVR